MTANPCCYFLDRHAKVLDEFEKSPSIFERCEVLALEIFNKGHGNRFLVFNLTDDARRNHARLGSLGHAQPPRADDQLILVPLWLHNDCLEHSLLGHRLIEFSEFVLIVVFSYLEIHLHYRAYGDLLKTPGNCRTYSAHL